VSYVLASGVTCHNTDSVVIITGTTGGTGFTGPRGDVGSPGQMGAIGPAGATGPQGFTGGTGFSGKFVCFMGLTVSTLSSLFPQSVA